MDFNLTPEQEAFRDEVRAFLNEHLLPVGQRNYEFLEHWSRLMREKRWVGFGWPSEVGGGGAGVMMQAILKEEMSKRRAPALGSCLMGLAWVGPAIIQYGTEEQKKRFIPPTLRGEMRWCQGYSEPGAGSDLAGLQCRAVRDGDHYVVNGQKIWTSDADVSDWIFCLVRTNTEVPKHEGISFLLIDMETEGVSTSPIELISGSSPFCQTFFDNVRVPAGNLIGEENKGWTIAKRLLQHERTMLSEGSRASAAAQRKSLLEVARDTMNAPEGPLPDAGLRDELVQFEMDRICYGATLRRTMDAAKAGRGMGPESSMFKLFLSEMNQRGSDLRQRMVGSDSLVWAGEDCPEEERQITREWLYGKASTILGGTSEIQLNIITKRVLGLPE